MKIEIVRRVVMFVTLFVVQVLFLNRVWLFNMAMPMLYVFFVITFRRNTPKGIILVSCFLLGLSVDVFSNTPGLAAGGMTLIGMLQPYLLELFVPRDSADNMEVSVATLGYHVFCLFSFVLTLLYCLVFFALEAFNFFDWQHWLLCSVGSALFTMVMMIGIESVRSR